MKKLSVITITFNNYEELLATINSTNEIDFIENVVINGGQCTQTARFLLEKQIKHLSEPDKGIADAFNKGIRIATGEYIIFLNSGDLLIDKSYWDRAISLLNSDPSIDFTHSNIIFNDPIAGELIFEHTPRNLGRGMPYYHQTLIVRKQLFEQIGCFYPYSIAMDYDFTVRMYKASVKGQHFPIASVKMDGNGVSSNKEWESIKQCFKSLRQHNSLNAATFFGLLQRIIMLASRKIILTLFGKKLLAKLKSKKYKQINL